jgi:hypothetical protein
MEVNFNLNSPDSSLLEAMNLFFNNRSFGTTQNIFFKLFQCWGIKECDEVVNLSNEEVALFLDDLLNLVSISYIAYQANKKPGLDMERNDYE